jgi:hypothetical protein
MSNQIKTVDENVYCLMNLARQIASREGGYCTPASLRRGLNQGRRGTWEESKKILIALSILGCGEVEEVTYRHGKYRTIRYYPTNELITKKSIDNISQYR